MNTELNIERINFKLTNLKLPIIIIIGPPGAGKTAVGTQLAKALDWHFYDTDVLIERAMSMKVPEIFSKYGEIAFRQLENALVNKMIEIRQKLSHDAQSKSGTIISCGGGLPVPAQNFAKLAKLGKIICLQADAPVLLERMGDVQHRPLLNPNNTDIAPQSEQLSRLKKLLRQRQEVYAKAHHQVNTNKQNVETVVKTIRTLLKL